MRFHAVRSGLVEQRDEATVVACDTSGAVVARTGDVARETYYRSAIKPLQGVACLEAGLDVPDEHLAVACSSHSGFPVHLEIVKVLLTDTGLDTRALRCPADLPFGAEARRLAIRRGHSSQPIFHNCSGKHAAMLAACRRAGWPTETYLDPEHPLQVRVGDLVAEVTRLDPHPVGVDGCGAPTFRGTVQGLATAFARISSEERFGRVAAAMSRFPALAADGERPDGRLARWWGGPVKSGAAGVIGIGRHGIGIAAKSAAGSGAVAVAAVITMAASLGMLSDPMLRALADEAAPPVFGGGRRVGRLSAEDD